MSTATPLPTSSTVTRIGVGEGAAATVVAAETGDVMRHWDRAPVGARHPVTTVAERLGSAAELGRDLAAAMLRVHASRQPAWQWEQGFIATQFADEAVCELPTQRYFYPYFDGLPGGMLGYDYARNPCGFASIHFGCLIEKPSDCMAQLLAPAILGRRAHVNGGS